LSSHTLIVRQLENAATRDRAAILDSAATRDRAAILDCAAILDRAATSDVSEQQTSGYVFHFQSLCLQFSFQLFACLLIHSSLKVHIS
jgi:hypothetical protein